MKYNDLISVIIPVYNAEKTIERCITSIQNQTYKNIEIIVVNDGSIDNTYEILMKLQENDRRINIVNKVNEGVSKARNTGLDIAKGDYITFVDSDDKIEERMYEILLERIKNDNSEIAMCGIKEYYSKDKIVEISYIDKDCLVSIKDYLAYMSKGIQNAYYGGVWNKLFSRKVCNNIKFVEGISLGEDLIFNIDVLNYVNHISVSSENLYVYYLDSEVSLTKIKYKGSVMWKNAKITYNKYIDLCNNKGVYDKNEKDIFYMYACMLMFPISEILESDMKISEKAEQMRTLLEDKEAKKSLEITKTMSYTWRIIRDNYKKCNYKSMIIKLVILEKIKKIKRISN